MKRRSLIVGGSAASLGILAGGAAMVRAQVAVSGTFKPSLYHSSLTHDHARRQDRLLASKDSIAIFGDSNTAGTSWAGITGAENYGIAGDTLQGLIYRLKGNNYASLAAVRAIVLANFPFNDLCVDAPDIGEIEETYALVLSSFPVVPTIIVPPTRTGTPVWNKSIATFNRWLLSAYGSRDNCSIVDISDLQDASGAAREGDLLDGQHWTAATQSTIVTRVDGALGRRS